MSLQWQRLTCAFRLHIKYWIYWKQLKVLFDAKIVSSDRWLNIFLSPSLIIALFTLTKLYVFMKCSAVACYAGLDKGFHECQKQQQRLRLQCEETYSFALQHWRVSRIFRFVAHRQNDVQVDCKLFFCPPIKCIYLLCNDAERWSYGASAITSKEYYVVVLTEMSPFIELI